MARVLGPALLAVVALVASACGGSNEVDVVGTRSGSSGFDRPSSELVIGRVLPETGSLAAIGGPIIAGVDLAVADVVAAGGRIRLIKGDSGTDPDVASETVNRLLGEGAQVIVGAAASGVSQSIIQTLYDAQIPQCAASNTSPSFSTQANAEYFFRTVTTSHAEAPVMANSLASGGATFTAVVARSDDYGNALARLLVEELDKLGIVAEIVSYSPDAPSFDATVEEVLSMGADSVGLIAFEEGIAILRGFVEAGVPPRAVHVAAGMYDVNLPERVNPSDPSVLDGLRIHVPSGDDAFNQRLLAQTHGNVSFGGQAYDCVVVLALAHLASGATSGPEFIEVVPEITQGGQKCRSYKECAGLLADGADIDYDGVSGPLELNEVGDPTVGRYVVSEVRGGVLEVAETVDWVMTP